jgi:hypothetical protein
MELAAFVIFSVDSCLCLMLMNSNIHLQKRAQRVTLRHLCWSVELDSEKDMSFVQRPHLMEILENLNLKICNGGIYIRM